MDLEVTTVDSIVIITLHQRLDAKQSAEVEPIILSHLESEQPRVLLDLRDVSYMSSAGLRLMLMFHRTAQEKGGKVGLIGISEHIRDVMSATGFLEYFTLFHSVDEGLNALRS